MYTILNDFVFKAFKNSNKDLPKSLKMNNDRKLLNKLGLRVNFKKLPKRLSKFIDLLRCKNFSLFYFRYVNCIKTGNKLAESLAFKGQKVI